MKNYTLVVIDMQLEFDVHHERKTIAAVKKEILKANKHQATVIFVEYRGFGLTWPSLVALANKRKFAYKSDMDGSESIVFLLQQHNLPTERIKVCGLFATCCVLQTTIGLLCRLKDTKIQVVKKATDQFARNRYWWKKEYGRHENLRLQ